MGGIATWLTVLVLGSSALFAYFQLRDARSLREEEARPVVVVDLDVERKQHLVYIYLENYGKTTAHDVTLSFSPPLETSLGSREILSFFDHTFPTLPPGKRIDSLLDNFITRHNFDLPPSHVVTVSYHDRHGKEWRDPYVLDIAAFHQRMFASEKKLEDLIKAVEDLKEEIRGWRSDEEERRLN